MSALQLSEAQERRVDLALDQAIDERLGVFLSAKDVGPGARKKLKGLLKHYAKMKRPFTACVRDNTKRFGREGAERVCATLKDIIRGTTKWRKGKSHDKGTSLSYTHTGPHMYLGPIDTDMPEIDDAVLELIDQLSWQEIDEIVMAGQEAI